MPHESAAAVAGPTMAGPAGLPVVCDSSRSGAMTTSASASSPSRPSDNRQTDPAVFETSRIHRGLFEEPEFPCHQAPSVQSLAFMSTPSPLAWHRDRFSRLLPAILSAVLPLAAAPAQTPPAL